MAVRVTPGPATPPEERLLYEAVRARTAEELREIRAVAANWRTALAAMLALVTTVSVVRGRDATVGLSSTVRIVVGGLLLAAVITASVGAFLSARSSFGMPREEPVPSRLGDLLAVERARVRVAVRDLRAAIVMTFITLALIVTSVATVWYA
jgi:hypothetical protein